MCLHTYGLYVLNDIYIYIYYMMYTNSVCYLFIIWQMWSIWSLCHLGPLGPLCSLCYLCSLRLYVLYVVGVIVDLYDPYYTYIISYITSLCYIWGIAPSPHHHHNRHHHRSEGLFVVDYECGRLGACNAESARSTQRWCGNVRGALARQCKRRVVGAFFGFWIRGIGTSDFWYVRLLNYPFFVLCWLCAYWLIVFWEFDCLEFTCVYLECGCLFLWFGFLNLVLWTCGFWIWGTWEFADFDFRN